MEQSHRRFWYLSPSIQNSHFSLIFISLMTTLNERGEGILKGEGFIFMRVAM